MFKSKSLIALTLAAMLATSAQGHAQTQPDPHHPPDAAGTTESAPVEQPQSGMAVPEMMKMMAGMMKMMGGGGGQMGMNAMGMAEHNEGRIAFLRAELQISDAQSKVWDAFAKVLRDNAKRLMEANGNMMSDASTPQLISQLDLQERSLAARLEAVRGMKAATVLLYDALSEDQRKILDELLSNHMALMPAGMMQGGMMQGGMMMPAQQPPQ